MDIIKGLYEYVSGKRYREALGLPDQVCEEYRLLAQGEYNINYLFVHPVTGQRLLLRVNCGSQMHLEDQIEYEGYALRLLEKTGRTPKVLYVDGEKEILDYGILVMEYLPGHSLDYRTELERAAGCLADIHSMKLDGDNRLLRPKDPLRAILEECEEMVRVYMESALADEEKKSTLRQLLEYGWEKIERVDCRPVYRCCINTELNSTNFLINAEGERDYLIDWEKPLYGDPAQDLGHFIAPTTTFWKTDVILTVPEMERFLDGYIEKVNGRYPTEGLKERALLYAQINCLRGVTWCAMAWVQYQQPDKLIVNESTRQKLDQYLEDEFLSMIQEFITHR